MPVVVRRQGPMAATVHKIVEAPPGTRKIGGGVHVDMTAEMSFLNTVTKIIANLGEVDLGWIQVKRKGRSKEKKDRSEKNMKRRS